MADLAAGLQEAADSRLRMIATDGVFSMDGDMARLPEICDLAERHNAIVMVDDSHDTGILGPNGRGTPEHLGVLDRVAIITSTLGKALGGAAGGFTCARAEVVEYLRQRSRPYLFSNSVAPVIVGASLHVLHMIEKAKDLRGRLHSNTRLFRERMAAAGFDIPAGDHPIVPVMLGNALLATRFADRLLERGIYVIGFSYPVVPQGKARIRVQISAAHTRGDLELAVQQFAAVRGQLQVG